MYEFIEGIGFLRRPVNFKLSSSSDLVKVVKFMYCVCAVTVDKHKDAGW